MLALLALVMGCAVVLYSDKEERGTYLAILTGIVLLDALIWGIKGLLKRRGGSAELNRGITLVSVLILSFIFSFTYLRSVRNGQFDQTPENATRYEVAWSNGETSFYYAYDDPLPLYVQDLTKQTMTAIPASWRRNPRRWHLRSAVRRGCARAMRTTRRS